MLNKGLTKASESSILGRSRLVGRWSPDNVGDLSRFCSSNLERFFERFSERFSKSIGFIIGFTRGSFSWVKTPLGLEGLCHLLGCGELKNTSFLGDNCALVLGREAGDKLGLVPAGLLWVQVTNLFGNINNRGKDLVMAFLWSFFEGTSSPTNLNWKFLTPSISNELAWLFLDILGCAGRLIHSLANLFSLTVAHLLSWPVALSHCLVESLLLESDLTGLLKVFFTNLLLRRLEFCDISVVTLLGVLVSAL